MLLLFYPDEVNIYLLQKTLTQLSVKIAAEILLARRISGILYASVA
jgi:hypothetical protein